MTNESAVERVLAIVVRMAGPARIPPDVGPDTPLGDHGFWLDSVDLVEVIVACELEFSISFEGETDLTKEALGTARTLADLVMKKGAA